jgi:glycoprotein endo-alpha-1,2-mannosidase
MKEYGIDGAFVQRAVSTIKDPVGLHHTDQVLSNILKASKQYRRAIAIMYDFSGMNEQNNDCQVVINDWKHLVDSLRIACGGNEQTYLYHNGKPLVAIWGVGFPDRSNSLKETEKIIDFLKNEGWQPECLEKKYHFGRIYLFRHLTPLLDTCPRVILP